MQFQEAVKILNFQSGLTYGDAQIFRRKLNMKWHPDKFEMDSSKNKLAEIKQSELNQAWDVFKTRFSGYSKTDICKWSEFSTSNSRTTEKNNTYYKDAEYYKDKDNEYYTKSKSSYYQFKYIDRGHTHVIACSFFESFFNNLKSAAEPDLPIFVEALAKLFKNYSFTNYDLKLIKIEYLKQLWSRQDLFLFYNCIDVYQKFSSKYEDPFASIFNPYTVAYQTPIRSTDQFYVWNAICSTPLDKLNESQRKFFSSLQDAFISNTKNPMVDMFTDIDSTGMFYKMVIQNRPDLLALSIKARSFNLNNTVYHSDLILRDICQLCFTNYTHYAAEAIVAGWSSFKSSFVREILSLPNIQASLLLDEIIKSKPSLVTWVSLNIPTHLHPETDNFKNTYNAFKPKIHDQLDLLRLNQKLAIDVLNDKYRSLDSPLAKMSILISKLFNRSSSLKFTLNTNNDAKLDKLSVLLGINKEILLQQYNSATDKFEVKTELEI